MMAPTYRRLYVGDRHENPKLRSRKSKLQTLISAALMRNSQIFFNLIRWLGFFLDYNLLRQLEEE